MQASKKAKAHKRRDPHSLCVICAYSTSREDAKSLDFLSTRLATLPLLAVVRGLGTLLQGDVN